MRPARIAELLAPFVADCHSESGRRHGEEPAVLAPAILSQTQLESISTFIDILQHWNARINLTAIRDEEEIVTRHFGESFFAASHLFPNTLVSELDVAEARSQKPEARLADLGSGAGFPGLPIKLWASHIALTLIEANHKKATFLREVARALSLTEVDIQNVRAETLSPSTFDVVTFRAVEHFAGALSVATRLVRPKGRIALLISSAQLPIAQSAIPTLIWQPALPIPQSNSSLLLLGVKP
jgi:16S rRNA (guanine527-N7)-methyltransferase